MRITQQFLFNGLLDQLNNNRQELAKFQDQLSSGKRVTRPSDDNVAFGTSRSLEHALRENEQYKSNINTGLSHAQSTQEALDDMIDVMIDLENVAVNGATDTLSADDRDVLADKVASLRDRLIDLGNSKFNNTYLFGGTNSDETPFSDDAAAPGGVADTSTDQPLKIQVSGDATVETTVTGNELRATGAGDLFEILKTTENALRNNNRDAVSNAIGELETATDHVTTLATNIGDHINRMDFMSNQIEAQTIEQEGEVSRLTDTDYAEAISNFRKFETSYQAALNVHARMTQTSLLNYI